MELKGNKHCNIPIFIPQKACPHQCIYCNQRYISGQQVAPTIRQVKQTVDTYLSSVEESTHVQVAFFGGTFTGLALEEQQAYLQAVKPYITAGRVQSVRLSTRPDYINEPILDLLKQYNVTDIELGAQSLDDEVLEYSQRGHNCRDVITASNLINSYGFNLGLQMMIGLPKDTLEKSIHTAQTIVKLNAVSTRIYPTLVIERTPLATLYRQGDYTPLSIEQAVDWSKDVYKVFKQADVKVLRVGLHPSKDLVNGKGYIAGPFHISFFELVLSSLWKDKLKTAINLRLNSDRKTIQYIYVNPKDINYAIGYQSSNLKWLRIDFPLIKFRQNPDIKQDSFVLE